MRVVEAQPAATRDSGVESALPVPPSIPAPVPVQKHHIGVGTPRPEPSIAPVDTPAGVGTPSKLQGMPTRTTSPAQLLCGAPTKKGQPCKRRVREAGTQCHLHQPRLDANTKPLGKQENQNCGALTRAGTPSKLPGTMPDGRCPQFHFGRPKYIEPEPVVSSGSFSTAPVRHYARIIHLWGTGKHKWATSWIEYYRGPPKTVPSTTLARASATTGGMASKASTGLTWRSSWWTARSFLGSQGRAPVATLQLGPSTIPASFTSVRSTEGIAKAC
ncbi:hypothetical protein DFJ74DRAFT_45774 [Hyaloraphidium curvatum]|nr:hypothetical protein DFJ74DRAFT_45774 [Hyaloraphidium curvatum]